jgi:NAD(P)-dependent dehydrogenase (short-subunit alcohol dehydrogenase family)
MGRLDGKVAIVTGGASGIGRATCAKLTAEGATAVVADLDGDAAAAFAAELGAGSSAVRFDAEDPATIEAMVETVVERHGRVDALHNNAALLSPDVMAADRGILETSFELFDRVMATNVRGYLAACKFVIPHMVEGGGGSIVNTSSVAGLVGDVTGGVGYGVSKSAIVGLTRFVATTWGHRGIRCNAIAPGLTVTPKLEELVPDLIATQLPHVPVGRHATPDDIADLVSFLLSDESAFITGQVHVVDGGLLAHLPTYADLRKGDA